MPKCQPRVDLAQQRRAAGYTQEALAYRLSVDRSTITRWERVETEPQPWLRANLARVLGVSSAQLTALLTMPSGTAIGETSQNSRDGAVLAVPAQALRVAIAVVVRDADVLLVRRREVFGDLHWQFPAGVIKPGRIAAEIAVNETLAETGVHCAIRASLGNRTHPTTGAQCEYFLCDFLAGEAQNRDALENSAVIWVDRAHLTDFAPVTQVFRPVLDSLDLFG